MFRKYERVVKKILFLVDVDWQKEPSLKPTLRRPSSCYLAELMCVVGYAEGRRGQSECLMKGLSSYCLVDMMLVSLLADHVTIQ